MDKKQKKIDLKQKAILQKRYKILVLSTKGTNICGMNVGVQEIVKDFADKGELVPSIAAFKLFDFDVMEEYVEKAYKGKELENTLKILKECKKEFEKLSDACFILKMDVKNFKKKTKVIKNNMCLVRTEDSKNTQKIVNNFNYKISGIDEEKIGELLSLARNTINFEIEEIVAKYRKSIEREKMDDSLEIFKDLEAAKRKKLKSLPEKENIISRITIEDEIVLDISDEFLSNQHQLGKLIDLVDGDRFKELLEAFTFIKKRALAEVQNKMLSDLNKIELLLDNREDVKELKILGELKSYIKIEGYTQKKILVEVNKIEGNNKITSEIKKFKKNLKNNIDNKFLYKLKLFKKHLKSTENVALENLEILKAFLVANNMPIERIKKLTRVLESSELKTLLDSLRQLES